MQVKLIMTWDIQAGRDQDYFEFVVREYVPGVKRLGLQITQAWFTVYGASSQIMMEGIADDLDTMKTMVGGVEWRELQEKLDQYVTNFQQKIVRLLPRFQF
jgi:hypothetical protein